MLIEQLAPQVVEEREDRRLDRHVERGGGLVGNEDARLDRERARDRDALALSAREGAG